MIWNELNARVFRGGIHIMALLKMPTSTALLVFNQTALRQVFLHKNFLFWICLLIIKPQSLIIFSNVKHYLFLMRRLQCHTRDWLKLKTMFAHGYKATLYGSIKSGIYVHLLIHDDLDFWYSITAVLIRPTKSYSDCGKVNFCFTFPQLGFSESLCPSDLLLFNATEPHAISTLCNKKLDTYFVSFYLKSAVVGQQQLKKPNFISKESDGIQ